MLSSICYHPQSHVIVHVVVLSDQCYRPQNYVIVHLVFFRHHMRWYVLTPFEVVFLDTICGGILRHQLDSILKHHLRWYS